ncbi:hypothetical protein IRT45_03195 [Nocardia sp. BSTN01]|uniref:hypothetical protein n=1 Tax=Nocardia sp. BSTN01 TaxID=2783665 RepID=UPI00188F6D7E|nr:hypothetical protein [Nocardia sp. BSTN01]MBF4996161.1 hypothetical protein [Nocardia sp. BSTN01]
MSADRPGTSRRRFHALDVSDTVFWRNDFRTRDRTFATLRSEPGLSWHPPVESIFPHEERGYWAVTRHADIAHVSRHPVHGAARLGRQRHHYVHRDFVHGIKRLPLRLR